VNGFDLSARRPLREHFFRMLHGLASVNVQALRAKALLQQAALLSPLVTLADQDALTIEYPQGIADRIRSHEILAT
jgi:hypothetical protein